MVSSLKWVIWSHLRKRAAGTSQWSKESTSIFSSMSTLSEIVKRSMLQWTVVKREVACMDVVQEAKMSYISLWMRHWTMTSKKVKSRQAYAICPRKSCKLWKWKTWLMCKYQTKAKLACSNKKRINQSLNNKKTLNFVRSKKLPSNCKIRKRWPLIMRLTVKAILNKHKTKLYHHQRIRVKMQLLLRLPANLSNTKPKII